MTNQLAHEVFSGLYRDSVELMSLAAQLEKTPGVQQAGVVMGTPGNQEILAAANMLPPNLVASADDLIVVVRLDDGCHALEILNAARKQLLSNQGTEGETTEFRPGTIDEALADFTAELVSISTPGEYADIIAEQALQRGLHVFCFSDNVSIEHEKRLKEMAVTRDLLFMGPDCGTAIIDGTPLGFANQVDPGPVGIISASGTGAQEVSVLLDRAGIGISQLIGVGGRDLSADIGGSMTFHALDLLTNDEATECIVVISKPPAIDVARTLIAKLRTSSKPVIACLLGMPDSDDDVVVRGTLEEGALAAAVLLGHTIEIPAPPQTASSLRLPTGVLGLYAGGTLAAETELILNRAGIRNEVLDLGDDQYTRGKPHPMIDPDIRCRHIIGLGNRADIGVVLLDCVLGYGAHPDPAAPMADAIRATTKVAAEADRDLVFVGSVCGTDADPQGLDRQRSKLIDAGVQLFNSNAAAARAAAVYAGGNQ
jgi:FdrA protein